ncbi:MAG: hypothetical protein H6713_03455 [Myxococcales bacterium]|nr:hypothetical protein [Myxococcales bacterium]
MDPPRDAEASVSASRETAVAGASRAPDAALTGAEAAPDDAAADEESEGGGEVEPMADDDSPEAKPRARALPTTLDERALHRVLRRRAREVRRCGQQNGGLPNTRFEVRFTVRRSGDVEQATVEDPLLSPPLRRCLEAVVLRTRFPQAQEPTSGRYTFSF